MAFYANLHKSSLRRQRINCLE